MAFSRVLLALPGGPADIALEAHADELMRLLPHASLRRTRVGLDGLGHEASAVDADLIVAGVDSAPTSRRELADFVMRAPCSVWIAAERTPAAPARILTPVDLSERSAEALAVASHLVRITGGERCHVLHVSPVSIRLTLEEGDSLSRGRAERALNTFIARVDEEGVDVEPLLVEATDTANAIARAAQEQASDLIVMTTRGRTRLAARLLPSICAQVISRSATSVLAIKCHGAHRGVWDVLRDRRFRAREDLRFN